VAKIIECGKEGGTPLDLTKLVEVFEEAAPGYVGSVDGMGAVLDYVYAQLADEGSGLRNLEPADEGEAAMAKQLNHYYQRAPHGGLGVFVSRQLRAAGWKHPKYDKMPCV